MEKIRLNNFSVNCLQSYWIQEVWMLFEPILAMKLSTLASKHEQKLCWIVDQCEAKNRSIIEEMFRFRYDVKGNKAWRFFFFFLFFLFSSLSFYRQEIFASKDLAEKVSFAIRTTTFAHIWLYSIEFLMRLVGRHSGSNQWLKRNLHALHVCSGFLPQSKDRQVRWTGD